MFCLKLANKKVNRYGRIHKMLLTLMPVMANEEYNMAWRHRRVKSQVEGWGTCSVGGREMGKVLSWGGRTCPGKTSMCVYKTKMGEIYMEQVGR